MKNGSSKLSAVAALIALVSMAANSTTIIDPSTGRHYEAISLPGADWATAKGVAETMMFGGEQGHLATITSAGEQAFVAAMLNTLGGELWIGGFQDTSSCPPIPDPEPGCGWQWINGEGAIPGADSISPFAEWADGEPNNLGGNENELGIFLGTQIGWNDEGNTGNIVGFLVEFDTNTVEAGNCVSGVGVCNTSGALEFEIDVDPGEIPAGSTISQELVERVPGAVVYCDPRVNQVTGKAEQFRSLDIIGELGGEIGSPGDVVLPPTVFGSPCFALIKGDASFNLQSGVIRGTQFAGAVAGIGNIFGCDDPDFQKRLRFAYQTEDRNDMIERRAAAMNNDCFNPSRGATFEFSWWILNTHEDCLIDFDRPSGPHLVRFCFKVLAKIKFIAANISLKNSKNELISPRFRSLRRPIDRPLRQEKT